MKICALIPTWERVLVTIEVIKQLERQTIPIDKIVVVGSVEKDRDIMLFTKIDYLERPNQPLGAKIQAGVEYCRQFEPDALLMCGSDDWLSANWVEVLFPYLNDYDLVGADRIYAVSMGHHQLKIGRTSYEGTDRIEEPMGPGRLISQRILNKINWKLYPIDIDKLLDKNSMMNIVEAGGKIFVEREDRVKVLSPKGGWQTINSWGAYIRNHRIREFIGKPELWLESNFPGVLETLHKIKLGRLGFEFKVIEESIEIEEPKIEGRLANKRLLERARRILERDAKRKDRLKKIKQREKEIFRR